MGDGGGQKVAIGSGENGENGENARPDAGQWCLRISAAVASRAAESMRTRAIRRGFFKR